MYPLDRAFFYAPKPPTLLQFDDVAGVEFVRRGGGVLAASQKTFDLAVRVKDGGGSGGSELVFRGIAKQEWSGLFEFLKAKGIRIDNLRDAAAGAGGGRAALDLGGSRGGDGGGGDEDDDSGEDEEFEAGSESESSDEESDSADDEESEGEGEKSKSKSKSKKKKRNSSTSPAGSGGGGGSGASTPAKKKAKRKQAPREAGAPKKPMAAYMHFSNAKRAEVLAANPGMAFGEVGRATGELWRGLDAESKKPWEEAAARDKARFAEEEAAWQAGKRAREEGAAAEEEAAGGGEAAAKESE